MNRNVNGNSVMGAFASISKQKLRGTPLLIRTVETVAKNNVSGNLDREGERDEMNTTE